MQAAAAGAWFSYRTSVQLPSDLESVPWPECKASDRPLSALAAGQMARAPTAFTVAGVTAIAIAQAKEGK